MKQAKKIRRRGWSRARVLSSGLPGIGEIKATFPVDLATTAKGDPSSLGLVLAVDTYSRKWTSRKAHELPPDRRQSVKKAKRFPVKVDPEDSNNVEIDWDALDKIDAKIASRARMLSTGAAGIGEVKGTFGHKLGRRTPGGDYLRGIVMALEVDGKKWVSRAIHHLPLMRTHLVDTGKRFPVKVDRKDSNNVEIDWARFKKVDGTKVLNEIIARVTPVLKAAGYRKVTPRTFNSTKDDGLIHVINFQTATQGGSFTVNVAVYVRRANRASRVDEKRIEDHDCPHDLQWRIGDFVPKPYDRWWSFDSPDTTIRQLSSYFRRHVLPCLQKFDSLARVRKILKARQWRRPQAALKAAGRP